MTQLADTKMNPSAPSVIRRVGSLLSRHRNLVVIWGVLAVVFIVSALLSDRFTGSRNLTNLSRQSAALMLVAIGQTFVLLIGGIDLSVGSTMGLIVVIMAGLMKPTPESMIATSLVGIAIGTLVGFLNGLATIRLKISPFMTTLASLSIVFGLALQLKQNPPGTIPNEYSPYFTGTSIFDLPIPLLIILFSTLIAALFLRFTRLGRHIYAVGSNETATRLSGLRTDRIKLWAFTLCGFMTGLAGLYWAARSRAGDPLTSDGFGFASITAAVLGGSSLFGGVGPVWGTLAGVWIITILGNIMNLRGLPSNYQYVVQGVLLILAVMLYRKR